MFSDSVSGKLDKAYLKDHLRAASGVPQAEAQLRVDVQWGNDKA